MKTIAKVSQQQKVCSRCGQQLTYAQFYKSQSRIYQVDGKLPICKQCVLEVYEENLQYYKDPEKALYKLLFSLDIYFDATLSKRCLYSSYNTDKHIVREYFSSINLSQYKGKTSIDSDPFNIWDIPEDEFLEFKLENDIEPKFFKITNEMIVRWGSGRSNEDYMYLEDMYNTMIKTYDTSNPMSVETYKQIVLNYLDVKKIREGKTPDNKKIGEILKINSMLQADCRIKDVQALNDEDNMYWSQFIEEIEWAEPIPKPEKEFIDVDGIKKYIKKWFVEPFAKSRRLKENSDKSGEE